MRWVESSIHSTFRRYGFEERTATLGDAVVRYRVGGTGPPLVLVHGFGADGAWCWQRQARLARRRRVIVPDLLWFGGSRSERPPSLRAQVETLGALLDYEGVPRADILGVSYGGFVAFGHTIRKPERVGKLILVANPGPIWSASDQAGLLARHRIKTSAELVVPTDTAGVRRLIEIAWKRPPPTPTFILDHVHQLLFHDQVDEQRALIAELEAIDSTHDNWVVPHPTLLIWGEQDSLFPVDAAHRLIAAIGPHAALRVLAGTKHAPHLEAHKAFNAVVESFLG